MKLLWLQLLAIQLVAALHLSPRSNSKRGVAFAQSNSADLPKAANGQCSWIYNWSPYLPSPLPASLAFFPMQWGRDQIQSFENTVLQSGAVTILGFNEPDRADQSNIPVGEAASLWKQYIQPLKAKGVRLGSPAVSSGPDGLPWLHGFLQLGCTIDFLAIHWYGDGAANFIGYLEAVHSQFPNMPIFVTEFASTSSNPPDVAEFLTAALQYLDTCDWIQGYSWFAFTRNASPLQSNLLDGGGNLNKLGEEYI